ncbi:hypothetical protein H9L19_07980 [Weissella diestrammenae]|uniref:DUF2798 domain-containing protein n=1 Tax=Weissella diestrammenae TaxID=1162633 RepID=A0A7G9T5B3_9LACO|nr:hypothetical protein [Weissella diestrammenae]MCM0583146.1 hypothetical protein [Weissella diestrammenae]QNN75288.1 hypothetical protein H9L19_07980 [Weissella diestrammenae]
MGKTLIIRKKENFSFTEQIIIVISWGFVLIMLGMTLFNLLHVYTDTLSVMQLFLGINESTLKSIVTLMLMPLSIWLIPALIAFVQLGEHKDAQDV